MKGLKKVALASAIAAVSAGAQAELKALDDATMGELTGQAGLTIDIETKFTIGEFQYRDQDATAAGDDNLEGTGGSILIRGISQGGNANFTGYGAGNGGTSFLDNIRLTLDVAGADSRANGSLNYGFSEIGRLSAFLAANGNSEAEILVNAGAAVQAQDADPLVAAGARFIDGDNGLVADSGVGQFANILQNIDTGVAAGSVAQRLDATANPADPTTFTSENGSDAAGIEDGDLVLHFGFTDAFAAGGGFAAFANGTGASATNTGLGFADLTWGEARDVATRAVDYNFSIDEIALADSNYEVGSGDTTGTTTLISGLSISGFLGPRDIHIENDGNGFGADGSGIDGIADSGNADSKITISNYFRVTDLEVYIDIAGISLEGVQIHNDRGDQTGLDGTSSFGFAHSRQTIFAVNDAVIDLNVDGGPVAAAGIGSQYVDGLALNTEFKGDIDIDALRFGGIGEGESIGQIFLTDIDSVSNWTISAHD